MSVKKTTEENPLLKMVEYLLRERWEFSMGTSRDGEKASLTLALFDGALEFNGDGTFRYIV
jgi:hypothetical protein